MNHLRRLAYLLLMLASNSAVCQQDASLSIESVAKHTTPAIRSQRSPEFLVARTSDEWAAAWKLPYVDQNGLANGGPHALPSVDFRRSMIVGVILPTQSTGCTDVTIYGVIASNERVVVKYRERKPQSTDVCTQSFATAFHFVKVERSPLPVVFEGDE